MSSKKNQLYFICEKTPGEASPDAQMGIAIDYLA